MLTPPFHRSDLRKHEIRNHNRTKRDYIGGEPSYKQVERLQKIQEGAADAMEKWRHEQQIAVAQPTAVVQATYIDPSKEFLQGNHHLYFADVTGMIQQQPAMGVYNCICYESFTLSCFLFHIFFIKASLIFFFI